MAGYFYLTLQAVKSGNKYVVQYRNGEPLEEFEPLDDALSDWGREGFRLTKVIEHNDSSILLIMEATDKD